MDYLRGEAYAGLGDRPSAEFFYLRSYRVDPTYFWVVADLAVFYVSSDRPVADRRGPAAPYVSRLQAEFVGHWVLPEALERVAKLAVLWPRSAVDSPGGPGPD